MKLVQRRRPPKVIITEELVQMCTHPGCVYYAGSRDVFCYFHQKVHAGLISPSGEKRSRRRFKDKGSSTERLVREWDLGREIQ